MPTFNGKTIAAVEVWKAPDGSRSIFDITMSTSDGSVEAKTYSKEIGRIGFEGEVVTYEKEGRNGPQTFVKQAPREEGGGYGGGQRSFRGGAKTPPDTFAMYLSYAKDVMVALIAAGKVNDKYEDFTDYLDAVSMGGLSLYNQRPEATAKQNEAKADIVHSMPEGDTDTTVGANIDTTLDDLFGGKDKKE